MRIENRGDQHDILEHELRDHRIVAQRRFEHQPVLGDGEHAREHHDDTQLQSLEPGQPEHDLAREHGGDAREDHENHAIEDQDRQTVSSQSLTPQNNLPPRDRHPEDHKVNQHQLAQPGLHHVKEARTPMTLPRSWRWPPSGKSSRARRSIRP